MKAGSVKFSHPVKGYGFIVPDDGGDDVFFHHSEGPGEDLQPGDRVIFATSKDRRSRLCAVGVRAVLG